MSLISDALQKARAQSTLESEELRVDVTDLGHQPEPRRSHSPLLLGLVGMVSLVAIGVGVGIAVLYAPPAASRAAPSEDPAPVASAGSTAPAPGAEAAAEGPETAGASSASAGSGSIAEPPEPPSAGREVAAAEDEASEGSSEDAPESTETEGAQLAVEPHRGAGPGSDSAGDPASTSTNPRLALGITPGGGAANTAPVGDRPTSAPEDGAAANPTAPVTVDGDQAGEAGRAVEGSAPGGSAPSDRAEGPAAAENEARKGEGSAGPSKAESESESEPEQQLREGATYIRSVNIAGGPTLTLSAIAWSRLQEQALLNGVTVEPGDNIRGVNVKKIRPGRIELEYDGKTFNMRPQ